jgi:hypothetical protein
MKTYGKQALESLGFYFVSDHQAFDFTRAVLFAYAPDASLRHLAQAVPSGPDILSAALSRPPLRKISVFWLLSPCERR